MLYAKFWTSRPSLILLFSNYRNAGFLSSLVASVQSWHEKTTGLDRQQLERDWSNRQVDNRPVQGWVWLKPLTLSLLITAGVATLQLPGRHCAIPARLAAITGIVLDILFPFQKGT